MSKDEDDQDEEANIGVGKYPCMPSLVALQQMKNRLHLAYLGKKLMKWTALATGRELRIIAMNLNEKYTDFSKELADAFILLARCRYYYHDLNKTVMEDVQKSANLVTDSFMKTVSAGVRVYEFGVVDRGIPPYPYLGIEKGGQTISETKIAWEMLIRKMIMILQLRDSFTSLEYAHKSATKRMNVLSKLVIPRTTATIHYILSEIEEKEREEYFRMKKILQVKEKRQKAKESDKDKKVKRCTKCNEPLPETTTSTLCSKCDKPIVPDKPVIHEKPIIQLPSPPPELPPSPPKAPVKPAVVPVKLPSDESLESLPSPITPCLSCSSTYPQPGTIRIKSSTPGPRPEFTSSQSSCQPSRTPSGLTCISRNSSIVIKPLKAEDRKPLELGVIETEISILTRILRTRNRDGTITEEKEIVRVKKKRTEPGEVSSRSQSMISFLTSQSNQSSKTSHHSYGRDRTVGTVSIIKEKSKKKTEPGEICTRSQSMTSSLTNEGTQSSNASHHSYGRDETVGKVCIINQGPMFKSKSDNIINFKPMNYLSSRYCLSMTNLLAAEFKNYNIVTPSVFSPCKNYVILGTKPTSGCMCLTDSEIRLISDSSSVEKRDFYSDSERNVKKRFDESKKHTSYKSLHEKLHL